MAMIDIDFRPDVQKLRQFGYISAAAAIGLAALAHFRGHLFGLSLGLWSAPTVATLLALAAFSITASVLAPGLNRWLFVGLSVLTFPIGWLVSHVVLILFFYGMITPLGLSLRLLGRRPLDERFDKSAESYWQPYRTPQDKRRYFRQF